MPRTFLKSVFFATVAGLLAACQTTGGGGTTMSVDEALKTSITFGSADFIAPKRTIDDLTAIFGPMCTVDAAHCRKRRHEVSIAFKSALQARGEFLQARSLLGAAADAEWRRGNFKNAIKLMEGHADQTRLKKGWAGLEAMWAFIKVARFQAGIGNADAARSAMSDASQVELKVWPDISQSLRLSVERRMGYGFAGANGLLAETRGDLKEAEALFREAIRHDTMDGQSKPDNPVLSFDLARVLMKQGRFVEAEVALRKPLANLIKFQDYFGFYSAFGGQPISLMARILQSQGRLAEAKIIAERAINMFEFDCVYLDSITYADARQVLAGVLGRQGNWKGAAEIFTGIERDLAGKAEALDRIVGVNGDWALALARTGRSADARMRIEMALRLARERFGERAYQVGDSIV